ncbi:MAG: PEP-CTERM sorting domain-containing protein [Deltaproteobacteria bacterium]|nr:MAG: PEP-CTERM sorting domain-containing protein [Deltaproteobacteria bacterium]
MSQVRGFPSVLRQAAVTLLLAGGLALGGSAQAASFTNGDFESGVLEPWTTFLTDNGTIGVPSIVEFDIDGPGGLPPSLALELRAGQITHFTGLPPAGGGIEQIASFNAGDLSIAVDIAAVNPASTDNISGGIFELLFDGVTLDTLDFGSLAGNESAFGVLSGLVVGVIAADHTIAIRITRPREISSNPPATPLQYVDNVELSGNAVIPEPGSALLLAGALLGLATLRKRSRNRA